MSLPPMIGLYGVARAGKDTVAKILHDLYGYEPQSFSAALNESLRVLNPFVPVEEGFEGKYYIRYRTYDDLFGYEKIKENPEVRRLLQVMGTEVGRDMFGQDVWVDALFNNLPRGRLVFVNMRFPNEYVAVKDMGGVAWHVKRPGFEPSNNHISDTALDDYEFDAVIENDSSIAGLADKVIDQLAGVPTTFEKGLPHG